MIISDLSYLEDASEAVTIVGGLTMDNLTMALASGLGCGQSGEQGVQTAGCRLPYGVTISGIGQAAEDGSFTGMIS